jgi:hypothetical protein
MSHKGAERAVKVSRHKKRCRAALGELQGRDTVRADGSVARSIPFSGGRDIDPDLEPFQYFARWSAAALGVLDAGPGAAKL